MGMRTWRMHRTFLAAAAVSLAAGPADQLARAASSHAPTYVYNSGFLNARARRNNQTGVSHGGEMVFVWGFGPLAAFAPPQDTGMSDAMQRYWTNFARTGDPNGAAAMAKIRRRPSTNARHRRHAAPHRRLPQGANARTVKGDE